MDSISSTKNGFYNVIRWPDANGKWWLVEERTGRGYTPIMELHPSGDGSKPTYNNQLWQAARLLVEKGMEAVTNPHAATGKMCGCGACFCCAALAVVQAASGKAKE